MNLLKRVPVYAAGAGLAAALVAVADAKNWSGERTLFVALGVGVFYVVTILVPWLIRAQLASTQTSVLMNGHGKNGSTRVSLRVEKRAHGEFVVLTPDPLSSLVPVTNGDPIILGDSPRVATG